MADAGIGHNSGGKGTVAADELRLLAERIERLQEDRKAINDDIKDVKAEAKSRGYDVKTLMTVVKIRAMKREVYQEEQALLETYLAAFGID